MWSTTFKYNNKNYLLTIGYFESDGYYSVIHYLTGFSYIKYPGWLTINEAIKIIDLKAFI